jgi:isoleucyl-tRNA synthetase
MSAWKKAAMEDSVYKSVNSKIHFPTLEEETLAFWEENHIFEKSVSRWEERFSSSLG